MSSNINEIKELISKLTLNEILKLIDVLKEEFGVTQIASEETSMQDEEVKEQKSQKIVLSKVPSDIKSKFPVIKAVCKILELDMMKAKKLLENLPVVLKENATEDDIKSIQNDFKDLEGSEIKVI